MTDIILYPQFNNESASVLGSAIIVVILLNLIPIFSYPFYLLYTMIHEIGHVFATRLTGGEVIGFWVFSDATGLASWKEGEGDHYIILPAGYMGTTLFSAGLILLTGLSDLAPYILMLTGSLLILFIILYSRWALPEKNDARIQVTAIVGLAFGVIFIGIGWLTSLRWSMFMLDLLAIQGAFTSFENLEELADQVRLNMKGIDPDQMAAVAGGRAMLWVRIWSLLSILMIGAAIWFTWLRNLTILLNNS